MKNRALEAPIPDPTPVLLLITAVSILLATSESMSWMALIVPAVVLIPALIYFISSDMVAAVGTLIVATVISRFFLQVSTLRARPEHIAVGLLCCMAPFVMKRRTTPVLWGRADLLLLVYIGLTLFSSSFTSPEPSQTFKWAIQQTLVIVPYFLLRILVTEETVFQRIFQWMLWIGVAQAAYAIVCFFSRLLFGTEFGMAPEQYGTIPGTYGTQLEPNILGSYSSACLIMLLVAYFTRPNRKTLTGIGITYAAVAISLSRAAIAGCILAVLALLYCGRKLQFIRKRHLINVVVTVLAVTLVLAPILMSMYRERLSTLDTSDISEDTLSYRLISIVLAFEDIAENPVFGTGTSSFQLTFDWSKIDPDAEEGGWIANSEIRILHDSGILGLGVFVSFILTLLVSCWKVLKREFHVELLALVIAGLVYCVSFQATEGTLLGFFWVHLGLIACLIAFRSGGQGREIEQPAV